MSASKPLTARLHRDGRVVSLREYEAAGGYQGLRTALALEPQAVTQRIRDAGLRGRGGGGFPAAAKWGLVPMGPGAPVEKYVVANGDEMEPGTFKDRLLLEGDPHQLIEGMIIAGHAIGARTGIVFLRAEYFVATERVRSAIVEAQTAGYLGRHILGTDLCFELHVHTSAGRYICGEETALIASLEGRRAVPRAKPPFPAVSGLFGKPTLVNNVETLCNVPHILRHGAPWFRGLSKSADGGTKLYGASGRLRRPGCWELPLGTTARELIEEHAGGMRPGFQLRAFLPGGASTDFLTASHLDLPMDFDAVAKAGSRLGTGTMIVLDDRTSLLGMLRNLEHFFARESCGWCTPCRDGLPWTEKLLADFEAQRARRDDLDLLRRLTRLLGPGRTFCALAPGAMEPLQSALRLFPEDFERGLSTAEAA